MTASVARSVVHRAKVFLVPPDPKDVWVMTQTWWGSVMEVTSGVADETGSWSAGRGHNGDDGGSGKSEFGVSEALVSTAKDSGF